MMRKRATILAGALALTLASGCGEDETKSASPGAAQERDALADSPPPLAKLHQQRNELLGGGVDAFAARLAELKGFPVVVNKWASWCGPCRAEFPFFQKQALKRGRKVAFLGVNSNDEDAAAERFLDEFPVSFPSYKDPKLAIAEEIEAVAAFPATAFYDAKGKLAFVHQGGYANERALSEDIDRYAR